MPKSRNKVLFVRVDREFLRRVDHLAAKLSERHGQEMPSLRWTRSDAVRVVLLQAMENEGL